MARLDQPGADFEAAAALRTLRPQRYRMTPRIPLDPDEAFFFEQAGYGRDPNNETKAEALTRTALDLATAERFAAVADWSYRWTDDPDNPAEWLCELYDELGGMLDALGGIDLGPAADPLAHDYARVIQAELALQSM